MESKDAFRRWHGMASVLPEIKRAVGEPYKKGRVNGWAVMAVTLGVDEVCSRLAAGVDTISVIAGLLIVATMALCASPSDLVVAFMKVGDGTIDPAVFRGLYMTMALVSLVRLCIFEFGEEKTDEKDSPNKRCACLSRSS